MTKKAWYKLKLQVALGSTTLDQDFIIDKTGWCGQCKYREKCSGCESILIPTRTKDGENAMSLWPTGYYPKKFDEK